MKRIAASFAAATAALTATAAFADQPRPWQMTLQDAATPIMREVRWFEQYTLWFIVPITLLVLVLLIWVSLKYRASTNPNPSRSSHNTLIEVIWTIGPVVILLFIAVPSFSLLTAQYTPPEEPALTVKATGYQWYWGYEYQNDDGAVTFDSVMLKEGDRGQYGKDDVAAYPRLLAVDNDVVVPVNTTVRLLVTAADVIHSFALPSFGVKADAVPGRVNETWFKAEKEGIYYGQCSELCGKDHAFMPIAIRVVSQDQYNSWIAAAADDLAGANRALMASLSGATRLADAGAAKAAE